MNPAASARPAHIAMLGLNSNSHIYPTLGVVRELVDRGHRVSYGVAESRRSVVEPTGVDVVTYPSLLPDLLDAGPGAAPPKPKDAGEAMQLLLDEAKVALPHLTRHFDDDPPELILTDPGAMVAPVLAHRYGAQVVHMVITPMVWADEVDEIPEDVRASLGSEESARRYYDNCNAWLAENGIDVPADQLLGNPHATLSMVPRAMQPGHERAPESVRFVGPCLDPARLADHSWTPPEDDRPVVLVSLGNTFFDNMEFYRACVAAFANTQWQVVLVAGTHAEAAELQGVPNIEVRRLAPQLTVLERAAAFVTQAGMGSCIEALWYGVPTVSVPQGLDQFGNAKRLIELGAGTQLLPGEVSAESLRAAVEAVAADAGMARRLAGIRVELRAAGGADAAADAVEVVLKGE